MYNHTILISSLSFNRIPYSFSSFRVFVVYYLFPAEKDKLLILILLSYWAFSTSCANYHNKLLIIIRYLRIIGKWLQACEIKVGYKFQQINIVSYVLPLFKNNTHSH